MLPEPFSWDRAEARAGRFNGRFVIGVLTTGIYCLPSCSARQPKPENVRLFKTEADTLLFDALAQRVRGAPGACTDAAALARECGVSQTKLGDLLRAHAHLTPAAWLRRESVRAACRALLETEQRVVDV